MIQGLQKLEPRDIISILPHKPPAVLIDCVTEVEPDKRILAIKNITVSEPALAGHFPGLPLLPNTTVVELMLQTCNLLVYATEQYELASKVVTLVGINKAKFHRALGPGATIEIEADLLRKRSNVWRFACKTYEQDIRVAEAELAISIQDRSSVI